MKCLFFVQEWERRVSALDCSGVPTMKIKSNFTSDEVRYEWRLRPVPSLSRYFGRVWWSDVSCTRDEAVVQHVCMIVDAMFKTTEEASKDPLSVFKNKLSGVCCVCADLVATEDKTVTTSRLSLLEFQTETNYDSVRVCETCMKNKDHAIDIIRGVHHARRVVDAHASAFAPLRAYLCIVTRLLCECYLNSYHPSGDSLADVLLQLVNKWMRALFFVKGTRKLKKKIGKSKPISASNESTAQPPPQSRFVITAPPLFESFLQSGDYANVYLKSKHSLLSTFKVVAATSAVEEDTSKEIAYLFPLDPMALYDRVLATQMNYVMNFTEDKKSELMSDKQCYDVRACIDDMDKLLCKSSRHKGAQNAEDFMSTLRDYFVPTNNYFANDANEKKWDRTYVLMFVPAVVRYCGFANCFSKWAKKVGTTVANNVSSSVTAVTASNELRKLMAPLLSKELGVPCGK